MEYCDKFWNDIKKSIHKGEIIETICRKSRNEILEITDKYVKVKRLKSGKPAELEKEDFIYLCEELLEKGVVEKVSSLEKLREKGRSSIVSAIVSKPSYVNGYCRDRRVVVLEFKKGFV